jgi:general secretion pathway protein M
MSERFTLWWAERSPRERWLLGVMAALFVLVVGWLGIARPLAGALESAHARHQAAVVALAEARVPLAATAVPAAAPPLPIDALIARTGADAGFANARINAQSPTQASVTVEAGRPQALFGWVSQLEGQGLIVDSLRARPNQDRTLYVEIAFRAGGAR